MSTNTLLPPIELGRIVPGVTPISIDDKGINETFLGLVNTHSGQHKAYIKILDAKQLVNELVTAVIGFAIGLPIAEGFLLITSSQELPESVVLKNQPPGKEVLAFGSKDMQHPSFARRMDSDPAIFHRVLAQSKFKQWNEIILFDEWVANIDRHLGNILLGPGGQALMIDHGHCFTGPDWKATDLICSASYENRLGKLLLPVMNLPERVKLSKEATDAVATYSAVPVSDALAVSYADKIVAADEVAALSDFVEKRLHYLQSLVANRVGIPNLIPNIKVI